MCPMKWVNIKDGWYEAALQTRLAHGWEGVIENVLYHADRGDRRGGFAIPQRPVGRFIP